MDGRGTVRIDENASVSQSFRLDEQQRLERLSTQANVYGVTGTVTAATREPLDPFGDPLPDGRPGLRATQVAVGYRLDTGTIAFWKNRIRLDAGVQTQLAVDPEAFVRDNSLSFDLRLGVRIHRFLDLSFRSSSVNRHLYRYLPDTAEQAGDRWVNPIVDLARSFNFLNSEDRIASAFKLESLRIEALHRLGDWNLSLAYQGPAGTARGVQPRDRPGRAAYRLDAGPLGGSPMAAGPGAVFGLPHRSPGSRHRGSLRLRSRPSRYGEAARGRPGRCRCPE